MKIMRFSKFSNQQGMILLEALLAVAILAFGLTAVIQAMMTSLRADTLAVAYMKASGALERILAEKFMMKTAGKERSEDGHCPAPYGQMAYSIRMTPTTDSLFQDLNLYQAEPAVFWQAGKGKRTLSAVLLMPGEVK